MYQKEKDNADDSACRFAQMLLQAKTKLLRLLCLLPLEHCEEYPVKTVGKDNGDAEQEEDKEPAMPDVEKSHYISPKLFLVKYSIVRWQ